MLHGRLTGSPSPGKMIHLGVNIYVSGHFQKDRLLVECIGPVAREVRRRGSLVRFWFDRFDARGPHIFAVLTIPAEIQRAVTMLLSTRITRHLATCPASDDLDPTELAARHAACQGKTLCEPDRYPGFAASDSFVIFEHESDGYPFCLSMGAADTDALWTLVSDLSLWAIDRLGATTDRLETAVHWVATVDRALGSHAASEDYWRFHAKALLPTLEGHLEKNADATLASLRRTMRTVDSQALLRAWPETRSLGRTWPGVDQLVRTVRDGGHGWSAERSWRLLFALNHGTLKQLGLPVAHHVPLILVAWLRRCRKDPAESSSRFLRA